MSASPDATTRLVLAGLQDSGPLHWQSHWAAGDPRYVKLAHSSWDAPDRHVWVRELEAFRPTLPADTVIVAHSLGCLLAQLGSYALEFEVVYFVANASRVDMARVNDAVNHGIVERFGAAGIRFAYPTQRAV